MAWQYHIMHLERTVATIQDDGLCTIPEPSFMPYNLVFDVAHDISSRVNNLTNFYYWCASRVLTLDRKYAKEILNAIGAGQGTTDQERARIALSYHCVTLTDVFWVRKSDEDIHYDGLNLYNHSLSDAFVDVSLLGKGLTAKNAELLKPADSAGDVSTQGAVPKAWVRRNGVFYLLKDGGIRDVEAELLASRIARCFRVDQVLYESSVYNETPVTSSRLITSLDRSIVPTEYMEIYAANHDTTVRKMVEAIDPHGFHMMNVVDYLIGNTDRHWGNWGFLIDNRTNRPIKLHPLMDFNKAFLSYDSFDGGRCLTMDTPMSQRDAAIIGVRSVGINQTADVKAEWFEDADRWRMFEQRLSALKDQNAGS